ncbi:maleylpyruvate isomerase family mycothiol-dependent enzyme [Corynebacterium halotolerans]|uniref:Mycothiol-dependent maleylpyruvate isomerase n=1 Tax=Corynebacterium halotolerans YIM 70093 = DSM 44683 TaxID=1121362 RepID=M1NWT8_9CORY|nr:maleylpyruvate isomerase family mycothiol-dependent enzyme [Corynebacterium halotolerans]AGF71950.1 mycothiol-dependent maleylpyruvate isomerase [Corynebacterium halotolerans YIM 70093 = DSM 44683]
MAESFHDLPLAERLQLTRRGTAHYSGQLALLENSEFSGPTALEGWTRAHLIAHVGYNAAAICNLMDWATTGIENPMYPSPDARGKEIEYGATLIPDALRNLHDHTVARLDVAWRDAPAAAWEAEVLTAQGRTVPASETLWMRSREVWIHAVDLGVKAGFSDIPKVILETLLPEVVGKWRKAGTGEGIILVNDATGERTEVAGEPATEIHGDLAGLVRWATGRGTNGVTVADGGKVPTPPRWL